MFWQQSMLLYTGAGCLLSRASNQVYLFKKICYIQCQQLYCTFNKSIKFPILNKQNLCNRYPICWVSWLCNAFHLSSFWGNNRPEAQCLKFSTTIYVKSFLCILFRFEQLNRNEIENSSFLNNFIVLEYILLQGRTEFQILNPDQVRKLSPPSFKYLYTNWWKWKNSKCFPIKKQTELFCFHHSKWPFLLMSTCNSYLTIHQPQYSPIASVLLQFVQSIIVLGNKQVYV